MLSEVTRRYPRTEHHRDITCPNNFCKQLYFNRIRSGRPDGHFIAQIALTRLYLAKRVEAANGVNCVTMRVRVEKIRN